MPDNDKVRIHIDVTATPEQLQNKEPLPDTCPLCNTPTENGFGLAGGGYGIYVYCPNEACKGYFAKMQTEC